MKYYICTLVAIIAIFIASSCKAQSKLPDSVYPDSNSSVSYCKLNDSTLNVMITINHYKFIDEYSIIRNISYHKYLPSYLGKYRNSLIFINGESVNYRLITVYTLIDKKIVKDMYEMELCSNRKDHEEKYIFFYRGCPIRISSNINKVLFRKIASKRMRINSKDISFISSCNNRFRLYFLDGRNIILE